MGSVFSSGMIPLLPDPSAPVSAAEDLGYPVQIPKVFLDGASESYYPQMNFSRSDDAVVMLREHSLVTYTRSAFAELLAEDEKGNVIWVDGRNAPYEGTWSGKYLNQTRPAQKYRLKNIICKLVKKEHFRYRWRKQSLLGNGSWKSITVRPPMWSFRSGISHSANRFLAEN